MNENSVIFHVKENIAVSEVTGYKQDDLGTIFHIAKQSIPVREASSFAPRNSFTGPKSMAALSISVGKRGDLSQHPPYVFVVRCFGTGETLS